MFRRVCRRLLCLSLLWKCLLSWLWIVEEEVVKCGSIGKSCSCSLWEK